MRWFPFSKRSSAQAGGQSLQHRYRILRRLLAKNSEMLEWMAELEADLGHLTPEEPRIRGGIQLLFDGAILMAENLNLLTRDQNWPLYVVHSEIKKKVKAYLRSLPSAVEQPLSAPLQQVVAGRLREVGGKAAHIGELHTIMPGRVPNGFVITTKAYRLFFEENELHDAMRKLFKDLSFLTEREIFRERTEGMKRIILEARVPASIAVAIRQGVAGISNPNQDLWAVRSSAVGEDSQQSFAGQFDSLLNVAKEQLAEAYKQIIASRYSERAVLYRLTCGFSEVDTPMAVLFMPMIPARFAGVLYTRDPRDLQADRMMLSVVKGLADDLVKGRVNGDTLLVKRSQPGVIDKVTIGSAAAATEMGPLDFENNTPATPQAQGSSPLEVDEIKQLVETGLRIEQHWSRAQDIEWVLQPNGKLRIVQARPLLLGVHPIHAAPPETRPPYLEGGITITHGQAVGPAFIAPSIDDLAKVPEGAVLVVAQAEPEIAQVLHRLAGIIAQKGNPASHAATLIREFGIPCLYGVEKAITHIKPGEPLSFDASRRKVYQGILWPEVLKTVQARIKQVRSPRRSSLLHEQILSLSLIDPLSLSFRAKRCRSIHDIVRYAHEKAVSAMFNFGDQTFLREGNRVCRVETSIPLNLMLLDLGDTVSAIDRKKRSVKPEGVHSAPFKALWRGISFPEIKWAGGRQVSLSGFASVVTSSMGDPRAAIRGLGERNYIIVAPDYLNLNARLAYHFAMLDALVTNSPENNFVNFRFRGGGAGAERRDFRARFLAEILLRSNFSVDRRGDLVTAWLRRFGRTASEDGLSLLGKLMGCARQLDMLMDSEAAVRHYVESFLDGNYQAFS